jgi:hypothetical protein
MQRACNTTVYSNVATAFVLYCFITVLYYVLVKLISRVHDLRCYCFHVLCHVHTAALNTAFFQKINDGDIAVAGMALPVAGAILGLQLLHDLAHRVVAARTGSKDLFKVPIFLPSLQVIIYLSLLPLRCLSAIVSCTDVELFAACANSVYSQTCLTAAAEYAVQAQYYLSSQQTLCCALLTLLFITHACHITKQVGTYGTITPLATFPKSRQQLFDVSVAGPIVGASLSLVALIAGLTLTGGASAEALAAFPVVPAALFHSSALIGGVTTLALPTVMLQVRIFVCYCNL